jgi:hypothetical protein
VNRARAIFWVLLSIAALAVSWIATVHGMIGGWDIHVLGVRHGAVWDPGGPYLGSAILLFDQPKAPFVGHPGLTLMLVCQLVARTVCGLSGSSLPFQQFAGKDIYWVTLAAMVSMTALFLVTFAALERVAIRILEEERLAMLAVLAFATSYPVLYYLNKISPESLLVTFTLLAFLWLWKYYELGDSPAAVGFLALSAQASVAAVYTKFHIAAPILLFIPFQLLCRRGRRRVLAVRDAGLYVLFSMPLLVLGTLKVDWAYFFRFWFAYAPGHPHYAASHNWLVNVVANSVQTAWAMLTAIPVNLLASPPRPDLSSKEGLFFAAEGVFLLVAAAGLSMFWRASRNRPVLLAWFLGFVALTSVPYLQRGLSAWHYLHLQLACASIFFAYGLARIVHLLAGLLPTSRRGWALCCSATIAVHAVSIGLFISMQQYNASQYRKWEDFYRAPALVSDRGEVGLVNARTMADIVQPLGTYLPDKGFLTAFQQRFLRVLPDDATRDDRLRVRGIEIVVTERRDGTLTMRRVGAPTPRANR